MILSILILGKLFDLLMSETTLHCNGTVRDMLILKGHNMRFGMCPNHAIVSYDDQFKISL